LKADILLHHEGECLSKLKATLGRPNGLATVDCIWRRLDFLFSKILAPIPILARIPDGFKTAYPRRNEKGTDPESGLATIEALFVGSALLGTWDASLFSHYYFGRKFVEINSDRFEELGVHEAKRVDKLPILTPKLRNSEQRKRDRAPL
jgi:ribosome biogenesis protein Tsr3